MSRVSIFSICLFAATVEVCGQIRVLTPHWLVKQFKATRGHIEGSTATFGAPFYGEHVFGQILWGPYKNHTYCREDDYDLSPPDPARGGKKAQLINIFMVRRGGCSFTNKVKVAYRKGAHAVIIIDKEDSKLTSHNMSKVIVADDGYGQTIKIPSILISKDDGHRLIEAVNRTAVVIELVWDVPTDHVVNTDLWMSSSSLSSMKFLKEFSKMRRVLNEVVRFQPHYVVFEMPGNDPRVFNELCTDNTGSFCSEDPDGGGPIKGRDVLAEDVRQLCIHEVAKVPRTSSKKLADGKPMIEYAEKYWDYVERFLDFCPLDAEAPEARFGLECSERLQRKVGLDVDKVRHCVRMSTRDKLALELQNRAWSPRALRINGWRYVGAMDAELVTRAICSGFINKPKECQELLQQKKPVVVYQQVEPNKGEIRMTTMFTGVGVLLVLSLVGFLVYRGQLKENIRMVLHEEVMLEVQSQMGEYRKLGAH